MEKDDYKMYPFTPHPTKTKSKFHNDIFLNKFSELTLPFPSNRIAEVVYHVLRVETEPKRSGVTKVLTLKDNCINVEFRGASLKMLRTAATALSENINLITETIDTVGEPVSETYSHFV